MNRYLYYIALGFLFVVSLTAFSAQATMSTSSFAYSGDTETLFEADGRANLMAWEVLLRETESNTSQSLPSLQEGEDNRKLEGEIIRIAQKRPRTNSNPSTSFIEESQQEPVSLPHLSIPFNGLGSLPPSLKDQHVLVMGFQLAQSPSLVSYKFSGCDFDDNHARCILGGLFCNASSDLIQVDMSHNQITDNSIPTLSRVIRHLRLESFNLSANKLGEWGNAYAAEELIKATQSAPSMRALDLTLNRFIDEDKARLKASRALARIIIEEPSLVHPNGPFKEPTSNPLPFSSSASSPSLAPIDPNNNNIPLVSVPDKTNKKGTGVKYGKEDRQILKAKIRNMLFTSASLENKGYSLRSIMEKLREEKDQKWSRIDLLSIKGLLAEMQREGIDIGKALNPKAMDAVKKYIVRQSSNNVSVSLTSEQNTVAQDIEEEIE